MTAIARFINSSVGCKMVMALSGLSMVGFLLAHLTGNLLIYKGPEALNAYAKMLHSYIGVLWFLRVGLIASFVLHVYSAIRLTRLNRRQAAHKYHVKKPKSTLASRTMMLSGLTILSFIIYHLAHFTFWWTHPEFKELPRGDLYSAVILSFQSPFLSFFYALSVCLLMAHLVHGLKSFWKTMGIRHEKYNQALDRGSLTFGILLALGFLSIPVSIFLGLIK